MNQQKNEKKLENLIKYAKKALRAGSPNDDYNELSKIIKYVNNQVFRESNELFNYGKFRESLKNRVSYADKYLDDNGIQDTEEYNLSMDYTGMIYLNDNNKKLSTPIIKFQLKNSEIEEDNPNKIFSRKIKGKIITVYQNYDPLIEPRILEKYLYKIASDNQKKKSDKIQENPTIIFLIKNLEIIDSVRVLSECVIPYLSKNFKKISHTEIVKRIVLTLLHFRYIFSNLSRSENDIQGVYTYLLRLFDISKALINIFQNIIKSDKNPRYQIKNIQDNLPESKYLLASDLDTTYILNPDDGLDQNKFVCVNKLVKSVENSINRKGFYGIRFNFQDINTACQLIDRKQKFNLNDSNDNKLRVELNRILSEQMDSYDNGNREHRDGFIIQRMKILAKYARNYHNISKVEHKYQVRYDGMYLFQLNGKENIDNIVHIDFNKATKVVEIKQNTDDLFQNDQGTVPGSNYDIYDPRFDSEIFILFMNSDEDSETIKQAFKLDVQYILSDVTCLLIPFSIPMNGNDLSKTLLESNINTIEKMVKVIVGTYELVINNPDKMDKYFIKCLLYVCKIIESLLLVVNSNSTFFRTNISKQYYDLKMEHPLPQLEKYKNTTFRYGDKSIFGLLDDLFKKSYGNKFESLKKFPVRVNLPPKQVTVASTKKTTESSLVIPKDEEKSTAPILVPALFSVALITIIIMIFISFFPKKTETEEPDYDEIYGGDPNFNSVDDIVDKWKTIKEATTRVPDSSNKKFLNNMCNQMYSLVLESLISLKEYDLIAEFIKAINDRNLNSIHKIFKKINQIDLNRKKYITQDIITRFNKCINNYHHKITI